MNEKLYVVVQFSDSTCTAVSLALWEEHKSKTPNTSVKCLTEPLPKSVARKMIGLAHEGDNPDEHD